MVVKQIGFQSHIIEFYTLWKQKDTFSTAQGAGLGADIVYGGEDEDGSIVPAVKSNSVDWAEWE